MKKDLKLFMSFLLIVLVAAYGCKKDTDSTSKSLKEEFVTMNDLPGKGWGFRNNSINAAAPWIQGMEGVDKGGAYGFPAYSFKYEKTEYAYATHRSYGGINPISSWMITPVLDIKNGDKISFYTRAGSSTVAADRLQVRMNEVDNSIDVGSTPASVGKFTMLLKDINESLTITGYPQTWTRYEITIAGLAAPISTRIAFRYFPHESKAEAVGIDLFQFTSLK
jgi:hypothetical protein